MNRALVPSSLPVQAPEAISQREYQLLKGAMGSWRNILILKTLRATGLRISEVLRLTPIHLKVGHEIDFYLLIQRGKKIGKAAVFEPVYLPPELGVELNDYIKGLRLSPGDKIFPITPRQVERIFAAAGLKALGRKVHPHELRGLYIKTLIDGGLPVAVASKMVGHNSEQTTLKWYYKLTSEQRWEIQKRIPV